MKTLTQMNNIGPVVINLINRKIDETISPLTFGAKTGSNIAFGPVMEERAAVVSVITRSSILVQL